MALAVAELKSNTRAAASLSSAHREVGQPRGYGLSLVVAKLVMAATGAGLIGFLLVHLAGNLQIYLGAEILNAYAAKLKSLTVLLWVARLGLIVMFTAHIASAIYLKRRNRRARPQEQATTA